MLTLISPGMVLCVKSAEALVHMLFADPPKSYDWFPEAFTLTEKRLKESEFRNLH
jgi:hypothetical protein